MRQYFRWQSNISLLLVLIIIPVAFVFFPGFNHLGMYLNILTQASIPGILALGMLFVLISGDIDLSIGSQSVLYGILCGYLLKTATLPLWLTIPIILVVSIFIGILIGWCIDSKRLSPMIATISFSVILMGFAYVIAQGIPIFNIPPQLEEIFKLRFGGLSLSGILFCVSALTGAVILRYTYWGKFFYAVGCNANAAQKAGVPARKTRIVAYSLCSVYSAVAGIAYTGRLGLASLGSNNNYVLDTLTIVALGGVGFQGGKGRALPVFCSALLLSLLNNAFLIFRLAPYYQDIIKGAILFIAISTNLDKS